MTTSPQFQQHPGFNEGSEFKGPIPPIVSEWTQQPQPQHEGVVLLRSRAVEAAGMIPRSEAIPAAETAPESMRAFAVASDVKRLRMIVLAEAEGAN